MSAYSIDIDKYIDWYKKQSIEAYYKLSQSKAKRYILASYGLNVRYIKDSNNVKSQALSKLFRKKYDELEPQMISKTAKEFYYYPTIEEWLLIEAIANTNDDIENIERRLAFVKPQYKAVELRKEQDKIVSKSIYYEWHIENIQPLFNPLSYDGLALTYFATDLSRVKTYQYIDEKLQELGHTVTNPPSPKGQALTLLPDNIPSHYIDKVHENTKHLFVNSDKEFWRLLLSDIIPQGITPMEIKRNKQLDLCYVFYQMLTDEWIKTTQLGATLEKVGCFLYNGKPISNTAINTALSKFRKGEHNTNNRPSIYNT